MAVLHGRSSSHFTRVARIFALELGVPHHFEPVFDLTTLAPSAYGNNPALKIPVWVDDQGPLFGTLNICRHLVDLCSQRGRVVLPGDLGVREVMNVEEMLLHAMNADVIWLTGLMVDPTRPPPPKVKASLENALGYLDARIDEVLPLLPAERRLSFVEVGLYCLVTHLPFRKVLDPAPYARLSAFVAGFEGREAVRATTYAFDAPARPPDPSML